MKVLIKYCGGCNPQYDRNAILSKLKQDYNIMEFTSDFDPSETYDFVIVLAGCMRSCANHEKLNGSYGKMIIRNIHDYKILTNKLDKWIKKSSKSS